MRTLLKTALMAGVALGTMTGVASAEELGTWDKERFQVRVRAIGVLADGDGTVNGTALKTDVDNAYVPEVDLTYFFNDNISAEVIAATAKHDVFADANYLGSAMILPPTVTLQYHFTPDAKFSPYVGAGINYSYFYGEEDGDGFNALEVEGGFGLAAQAGFDYWLDDNWGLNLDVKYIDLNVDVDVVQSGTTALAADDVALDPWIVGAGVSYKF